MLSREGSLESQPGTPAPAIQALSPSPDWGSWGNRGEAPPPLEAGAGRSLVSKLRAPVSGQEGPQGRGPPPKHPGPQDQGPGLFPAGGATGVLGTDLTAHRPGSGPRLAAPARPPEVAVFAACTQ